MTNLLKLGKKIFTVGVVATTIFWSLGVAALVPAVANAATETDCATLMAGDLVKTSISPVIYAVNADKTKSYFPQGDVFKSWTADNKYTYKLISQACLSSLKSATAVLPRPGTYLVKEAASDAVYMVLPGNKLAELSATAATALYGTNYKAMPAKGGHTITMDDPSWTFYSQLQVGGFGVKLTESMPTEGALVKVGTTYYVVGANKTLSEVTATGLTANRFQTKFATTLAATTGYTVSATKLEAQSAVLTDRTQGAKGAVGLPTTTTPVGALTVSLSANTPAGGNLPSGTSFNELLKVTLTAGADGAVVNGLTLKKSGYSVNTNIGGIDVVDGSGTRHGNVVSSVNSDNEVVVLFGSNPVTVPANGSVVLTVRVNINGSLLTYGTLKMGVSKIDTKATVSGAMPFFGNESTLVDGSGAVAAATIDVGAISGTNGATLNADADNEQEITKFRISETGSKEDLKVYKLTLFNLGSAADADYKDVQLVANDGTVLATAQAVAQQVVFNLSASPYTILKGQYKDLTVRAKIVSGAGTSKFVQFVVYNNYDLEVKGADTGAFVLASAGTVDTSFPVGNVAGDYNKATIGTGSLSFNKASDSPSAAVTPGATNVVLAKYYVKSVGEDMELRKVSLGVIQTNNALTGNVYIKLDGANVWSGAASSFGLAGTAVTAFALNTYPTVKSNVASYITVEGNVPSTATSGVAFTVNDFDVTEVKKVLSNSITDPSVSVADGNQINVNAASMSAKTLSLPVAQSIVAGTTGFEFAKLELNANTSGEDVRVSSLIVSDTISGGALTNLGNLQLYSTNAAGVATQLTTSNSTATNAASTTFTLTNALVIPKGTTVTLSLRADVVTGTSGSHTFNLHSVSATGKDTGATVTATPSGAGQAMTVQSGPTVALSLLTGTNASPSVNKTVNIGTNDGTYFAFKVTPSNEAIKVRTIILSATSSAAAGIKVKDVKNIRLYRNSEATPFQTLSEMTCADATGCTATFTATDNLLSEAVSTAAPVTITVKADVGGQGEAKLGDNFKFYIRATSTDFLAVGNTSAASAVISGTPTASGLTYITPFSVKVTSEYPTAAATVGLSAGSKVAVFKVSNLGTAPITLTNVKFTDGGASTSTMTYKLWSSVDGGSNTDATVAASTTVANTVDFASITTNSLTINGGSWRFLTVKTNATAVNYDTFQMSASTLGDLKFTAADSDLGYDGNSDGSSSTGSSTGLYVDGQPTVEMITARS